MRRANRYVSGALAAAVLLSPMFAPSASAATAPFKVVTASGLPVVNGNVIISRYLSGDEGTSSVRIGTAALSLSGSFAVPAAARSGYDVEVSVVSRLDGRLLSSHVYPHGLPSSATMVAEGTPATLAAATSRTLRMRPAATPETCLGGAGGGWVTVYTQNHDAIVGEPHARYDDTVSFAYLSDHTSDLGVGITYDAGATWTASGSVSVAKSIGAANQTGTGVKGPYWAAYELGQFQFYHQHWINSCGLYYGEARDVAHAWTGQLTQGASTGEFDGSGSAQYKYAASRGWVQKFPAGYDHSKTSGKSVSYSRGLNLGPIQLSATTTSSAEVDYHWTFGFATPMHYLYGSNSYVADASIIYSC